MDISNNVYENMHQQNIHLPEPPARLGVYAQAKSYCTDLVSISGCGPAIGGQSFQGRFGETFTVEEGAQLARNCVLNILSVLQAHIEDLNRVKRVVKITVYVASTSQFFDQAKVANGASQLLVDLFGETAGLPSRSAVGVTVLPGNMPVEIDAIFELQELDFPD